MLGNPSMKPILRATIAVIFISLMACSGTATIGGGTGSDGISGESGVGGALGAPPAQPTTAAAQPLTAGFPAPDQDPNGNTFILHLLEDTPLCRVAGKDLVQFKFKGFAERGDSANLLEAWAESLSLGSLRVVDVINSRYTEIPFSYKMAFDEYGVKYPKVGYFEFNLLSPYAYHLKLYLIQPTSSIQTSTPWTHCEGAACIPSSEIRVVAKTASGDLEKTGEPESTIEDCQVGAANIQLTP